MNSPRQPRPRGFSINSPGIGQDSNAFSSCSEREYDPLSGSGDVGQLSRAGRYLLVTSVRRMETGVGAAAAGEDHTFKLRQR